MFGDFFKQTGGNIHFTLSCASSIFFPKHLFLCFTTLWIYCSNIHFYFFTVQLLFTLWWGQSSFYVCVSVCVCVCVCVTQDLYARVCVMSTHTHVPCVTCTAALPVTPVDTWHVAWPVPERRVAPRMITQYGPTAGDYKTGKMGQPSPFQCLILNVFLKNKYTYNFFSTDTPTRCRTLRCKIFRSLSVRLSFD